MLKIRWLETSPKWLGICKKSKFIHLEIPISWFIKWWVCFWCICINRKWKRWHSKPFNFLFSNQSSPCASIFGTLYIFFLSQSISFHIFFSPLYVRFVHVFLACRERFVQNNLELKDPSPISVMYKIHVNVLCAFVMSLLIGRSVGRPL